MVEFSRHFRLGRALLFNKEWEADTYALVLLLHFGDAHNLRLFLDRHPTKIKWAILATVVSILKAIPRVLAMPFKMLRNLLTVTHRHDRTR